MAFGKTANTKLTIQPSHRIGATIHLSAWANGESVFHMVPSLGHSVLHTSPNPQYQSSATTVAHHLNGDSELHGVNSGSSTCVIEASGMMLGHNSCSPMLITSGSHIPSSEERRVTPLKEKKHKCNFCGKHFTHRHHLKTHEKTHTNDLEHGCSFCDRRFNRKDVLQVHERSHTGEKPYKCRFCDEVFSDCRMRTRHEARLHPDEQYVCELCGEIFGADRRQFSSHMKKTHRSAVFKCDFCSLSFLSLRLLQSHIQVHHQIKEEGMDVVIHEVHVETPEIQMIIGETSSDTLKVRPTAAYKCSFCTRSFSRKDCWKKHERAHTGEKPYKCRFCMNVFACTTARSRHELKSHQGEKYECETCKQQFNSKQMYNSHMKFQHSTQPQFRCGICAKRFKQPGDLNRHKQNVHSSHDERLMRACSSLLPSHISEVICRTGQSILDEKHNGTGNHFLTTNMLADTNEDELFET